MPARNAIKQYVPEAYYHVYARGASKQPIFLDANDFAYLQQLFARYLSDQPQKDKNGIVYPHYSDRIELLAYCLMGNHFHLLIWQRGYTDISQLMKSIMTSYSRYFNLKHKRSGSLFETRYKARHITDDSYLQHISRYIHLNPRYWRRYRNSSLQFYFNRSKPEWLKPGKIEELFGGLDEYVSFLRDYEDHKQAFDKLKNELANL